MKDCPLTETWTDGRSDWMNGRIHRWTGQMTVLKEGKRDIKRETKRMTEKRKKQRKNKRINESIIRIN